jgi:hypothetical protein
MRAHRSPPEALGALLVGALDALAQSLADASSTNDSVSVGDAVRHHTAEDQGPGRKYTPYAVCVLDVGRKDVIHDSHAVSALHQHTKVLSHADIAGVLGGADVEMPYSADREGQVGFRDDGA